jgi:hypothetical protein
MPVEDRMVHYPHIPERIHNTELREIGVHGEVA